MQAYAAPASAQFHKLRVDHILTNEVAAAGGRLIADYGAFAVYQVPAAAPQLRTDSRLELRDDYNRIFLDTGAIDTARPSVKALATPVSAVTGKRLHLVQFAGPIQPAWYRQLAATGVRIVSYLPQNAYLVYGDAQALARVQALASVLPQFQWNGPYADAYKVNPGARARMETAAAGTNVAGLFMVQLVADPDANAGTLELLKQLQTAPIRRQERVLDYLDVLVSLPVSDLDQVAAQPDVISIQAHTAPRKFGERQDQIAAGNVAGNNPSGPGYLGWLASKGFTQAQFSASGLVVDVSDSGIDNGKTSPNHFGLYVNGILGATSRVVYNRLAGTPNPGSTLAGCDGHGTLNAHLIAGYDDLSGFPFADNSGFHYGLGVCPFVELGSSVIFDPNNFTNPNYSDLQSRAYHSGARISNNSWGAGSTADYDADAQAFDALARDAQPTGSVYAAAGNQEMVMVFAAGNDGPSLQTIGSPGTAKNVITVGAAEGVQFIGGTDASGVSDTQANSANDMLDFSSRGPCADGRHKPDLVAPGTHISGGVYEAANPAATGTAAPCYTGEGISGGPSGIYFPSGQEFYTSSSGTSHSCPCVSGGCALVWQYFLNHFASPPSPAMVKAYLMNSARYLTGAYANDSLWSDSQGMGEMDLGRAFDGVPRVLRDQRPEDLFTATGQTRVFTGTISDTGAPFRVTLAWTDAPGSTTASAYNNNLDLTVTVAGSLYKGNVFSGPWSVPGGASDTRDNVESVFLPAGVSGSFAVQVTAANINSDGVPNNGQPLDQDFALVIYNATAESKPIINGVGSTLLHEGSPPDDAIDPGEPVTVGFSLQNLGTADTTNLVATLETTGGVTSTGQPQTYGVLVAGGAAVSQSFSLVATGQCGSVATATLDLQDGPASLGKVSFDLRLGRFISRTSLAESFDGVAAPALPSQWTTATSGGGQAWKTSHQAYDTAPNAAFGPEPTAAGTSDLVSPVTHIDSATAQLIFRGSYNLEQDSVDSTLAYDGGVLEIRIGNGPFADILAAGGTFVSGGYTATIDVTDDNPLDGRQVWSGSSGGFITTQVLLPASAAGQDVQFRWRLATDSGNYYGGSGWYIDTVSVLDGYYSCASPSTLPAIQAVHVTQSSFGFSFQTLAGQAYTVEYSDDLDTTNWTPVESITGDGSPQSFTNSLSFSQRFYRIRSP